MIILLFGDDTYRSRQRLKKLRDAFRKKYDKRGVNIVTLDGETMKPEQFNEHFASSGLLVSRRFVVVNNLLTCGKPAVLEAVAESIEDHGSAAESIAVFWEEEDYTHAPAEKKGKPAKADAARLALWNVLVKIAKKESFSLLEGAELSEWIAGRVQESGGTIEKVALTRLVAAVGSDLWWASSEIEKLVHYASGKTITEADVGLLVAATFDDNIFALTDALGNRDTGAALRLLEEQFALGVGPLFLISRLAWHCRNLIGTRALLDEGKANPRTIASQLQIHPFVAQKCARQAEAFTLAELIRLYGSLAETDEALKTRRVDARVLLDLLAAAFSPATASVAVHARVA